MEDKDNIEIKLEGDQKELIIRKGEARPIREQNRINITGVISSPRLFWEKRKAEHEKLKCHILYCKRLVQSNSLSIRLIMEEDSYFSGDVVGILAPNPLISEFGINTGKTYDITSMKKFLKMNRAYFKDRESNMTLVSNLEKFSAKVKMDIDNHEDDRGNYNKKISQQVEAEFPLDFALKFPPYYGTPEQTFKCEICFSITNGILTIWLESPDLQEILIETANKLISDELKAFTELVCIEQM